MDNEKKAWLEVSLQCSGELAEAVAEVLARFCPEGVVLDSITRYDAEKHEHIPTGMMRVAAYLPQDSELENKKRSLEEALWYMGRIVPLAAPEFVSIEDQDWMTVWKQNYQPLRIGENWLILPAWLERYLRRRRASRSCRNRKLASCGSSAEMPSGRCTGSLSWPSV